MIITKVRGKNFLSIGNAFLEFDVQKYPRTVIQGFNGSLKSGLASLVTFGLFGQSIKNINKNQCVNSINGKGTLVEVEFIANTNQYLIRRGIKPNLFEIIENGKPLEQTNANDFQEFLERNILKTNMKTFLQTSILSVENYKPFMTLRSHERRAFIEEILDIKVFSYMNSIVKTKNTKNREELKLVEVQLKNSFAKAKLQKSHIEQIESIKNINSKKVYEKIESLNEEYTSNNVIIKECNENINVLSIQQKELLKKSKEHELILTKLDKIEKTISDVSDRIASVDTESICPVCSTELHETVIHDIVNPLKEQIKVLNTNKDLLIKKLSEYENIGSELEFCNKAIAELNTSITVFNSSVTRIRKEITTLESEISKSVSSEELSDLKADLKVTATEALQFKQRQADLNTEHDYNNMMIELFKDSGIKSKIVDQYIPIINSLINGYLEKLDFFVSFNLDSEFNEIIKSRHRDDFTYGSFSAGERTKIDLALLFTFRQLSKIKNSFDCNMLFIDEILEFLDQKGVESFLAMIEELDEFKQSNIFIISHKLKDQLAEIFEGNLMMYKESGFSLMDDLSK